MKKELNLKIIGDISDFNQECLILYYGEEIALGVQGGNIDSNLDIANIYFKWGFTIETLRKCLVKIGSTLQEICPNVTNIKYDIKDILWGDNSVITKGTAIIEYDLAT